jgi:AraC-like DNA-binding protein
MIWAAKLAICSAFDPRFGMDACPMFHGDAHLDLKAILSSVIVELRRTNVVCAHVDVVRAYDLLSYSNALGGGLYPLQVSPGRLHGMVAHIRFCSVVLTYEFVNRDLICYDAAERSELAAVMFRTPVGTCVEAWRGRFAIRQEGSQELVAVIADGISPKSAVGSLDVLEQIDDDIAWSAMTAVLSEIGLPEVHSITEREIKLTTKPLEIVLSAVLQRLKEANDNNASRISSSVFKLLMAAEHLNCLRIETLAAELKMSRRNLVYCTTKQLQVPPKKLVKYQALRNVMRSIPECVWQGKGIGDIAYEHGFEHFPQFCADYRRLFGERPTDTCKRLLKTISQLPSNNRTSHGRVPLR